MKFKIFDVSLLYKHSKKLDLNKTDNRLKKTWRISIYNQRKHILKKLLLIALVFVSCALQVNASDVNTVKATIVKHSIEMGVDPAIALSIAKTESGFRHEARSAHGAVGVFQLMPSTAKRMGYNAYSLNDNIRGGIMYYKSMYKMFGSMELALAAYNAGPGNVKRYNNKVPPYAETKRFVARIMNDYHNFKANPDPAMVNASKPKPTVQKAAAPAQTPNKSAQIPAATKAVAASEKPKAEVKDDKPVELEVKPETFAI